MTTLQHSRGKSTNADLLRDRLIERRRSRRHDLEQQSLEIDRWDSQKDSATKLGQLVDLSSGGVRIRTNQANLHPDQQIRVRLELPTYAGISPFLDTSGQTLRPKNEWVGWMAVTRVQQRRTGEFDVAGRLMDMEDLNRGMLSLYLSTQPMAA